MEELTTEQKFGMLLCARAFGHMSMEQIRQAADDPIFIVTDMEMGCPAPSCLPRGRCPIIQFE